jgi:hypothetical protein
MKKLLTSNITNTAKMPIRKMTLDHVQESYNEQIRALAIQMGTDDYPGTPGTTARDILFGLQSTTVGSAFTANRGAVYSQGEIFLVDAASFTIGAGQFPIFVLATTYATGDPTEFTDGNQYQIHQIRKLTLVSGTTSTAGYFDTFSLFSNKTLPTEVRSGAGITNGANITGGTAYAKKDHLGVVVMHGSVQMNSTFSATFPNNILCTLPATHRPLQDIRCIATISNGVNYNSIVIDIDNSTGNVFVSKDPNTLIGNNAAVSLDSIVFYTI